MKIRTVLMRGGTSKGAFFHRNDLPESTEATDRMILSAFGSPDPYGRQIDGIGGATSTTSKAAIIGDGRRYGVDISYEFLQVSIRDADVDRRSNCGNISSAVGPFAVDEGLVEPVEPVTEVSFINLNTGKKIVAHVPTRNGRFDPEGAASIPGVHGFASDVALDYLRPGGAVTGRLHPTGRPQDEIEVDGVGALRISIVDAANPLVFVDFRALGLDGTELPPEIEADAELRHVLERIRARAAVLAGICRTEAEASSVSRSAPKIAFIGPAVSYATSDGTTIARDAHTLRGSMMSMGQAHQSYPLTGAICTVVASHLPGTLPAELGQHTLGGELLLGHPAGVLTLNADIAYGTGEEPTVEKVRVHRTARRLMEGWVHVRPGAEELGSGTVAGVRSRVAADGRSGPSDGKGSRAEVGKSVSDAGKGRAPSDAVRGGGGGTS